jgi:hypothetical protein
LICIRGEEGIYRSHVTNRELFILKRLKQSNL